MTVKPSIIAKKLMVYSISEQDLRMQRYLELERSVKLLRENMDVLWLLLTDEQREELKKSRLKENYVEER